MARQWFLPWENGGQIDEDGVEEWFVPAVGQINEDQAVAAGANPKGPFGMPFHGPFGGPV